MPLLFGKYGQIILDNMEKNYPERTAELVLKNELKLKIFQREQYILEFKELVEKAVKNCYPPPLTREMYVMGKYQELIDAMVEEKIMQEVLKKV